MIVFRPLPPDEPPTGDGKNGTNGANPSESGNAAPEALGSTAEEVVFDVTLPVAVKEPFSYHLALDQDIRRIYFGEAPIFAYELDRSGVIGILFHSTLGLEDSQLLQTQQVLAEIGGTINLGHGLALVELAFTPGDQDSRNQALGKFIHLLRSGEALLLPAPQPSQARTMEVTAVRISTTFDQYLSTNRPEVLPYLTLASSPQTPQIFEGPNSVDGIMLVPFIVQHEIIPKLQSLGKQLGVVLATPVDRESETGLSFKTSFGAENRNIQLSNLLTFLTQAVDLIKFYQSS